MSSDLALPILKELAQDRDFALRKIAVMGFGNHPTEESWQLLQQVLETEQDANVLAETANSLFEFGDRSIEPLQELFSLSDLAEDKYWCTMGSTAIALTASQDPQARELLSKLRQDEHYRVVAAALEQPKGI